MTAVPKIFLINISSKKTLRSGEKKSHKDQVNTLVMNYVETFHTEGRKEIK